MSLCGNASPIDRYAPWTEHRQPARPCGSILPLAPGRAAGHPLARSWGVVLVVALLHLGRDVLIPFAIAILLSFALAPIVTRLRHIGVPRVPAVLLIVTLAFTALGGRRLRWISEPMPTMASRLSA